jgi:hypothetical protein
MGDTSEGSMTETGAPDALSNALGNAPGDTLAGPLAAPKRKPGRTPTPPFRPAYPGCTTPSFTTSPPARAISTANSAG